MNQRVAVRILESLGYRADVAADGRETLDAVARGVYDVVLMDVQMPMVDGLAATRRIRSDLPPDRQPRIVGLTANAMPSDRRICLDAGMDDYLAKPIRRQDLAAKLLHDRPDADTTARADAGAERAATPGLDLASLRSTFGEEQIGRLLDLYLRDAPRRMKEIEAALAAEDDEALVRAAHQLRGSSGYLGAHAVVELCLRLEEAVGGGSDPGGLNELAREIRDRLREIESSLSSRSSASTGNAAEENAAE